MISIRFFQQLADSYPTIHIVTEQEVARQITGLRGGSAPGWDGVLANLIKYQDDKPFLKLCPCLFVCAINLHRKKLRPNDGVRVCGCEWLGGNIVITQECAATTQETVNTVYDKILIVGRGYLYCDL
ncbi:hypothetical protein J6590_054071 [Homalodisca vitripennis]|nr:hypothetical protein J6590_054071 [Homalodisca vitripennis]